METQTTMRPTIGKTAMTANARRKKSDDDKVAAGESRITTWITKEATTALKRLSKRTGDSKRDIVSAALIDAAREPER